MNKFNGSRSLMPRDIRHSLRKLGGTINIVYCLFMARTFGEYQHSTGGPDEPPSAVYIWRGQRWSVPTGSLDSQVLGDIE